jgi:ubiquinone/menaquinone biosynthesis C-methylase UbiE
MGTTYQERLKNELATHSGFLVGRESESDVVRFAPNVPAFDYAMQLYGSYVAQHMPNINVQDYIQARSAMLGRPSLVMSLGCGTGDWEFDVARKAKGSIEFELVDINEHNMSMAKTTAVAENVPMKTIVADVNRIQLEPVHYDFVLCRSSLHHFLDLEHVFSQIRLALAPGGAFIVIGEWVGRNGLQRFPETEQVAKALFDSLPDRLRKNSYTGEIDKVVPHIDHSATSFEAIRSEEIMPLILRYFEPVEYVLFDAFVSMFLDFRYGPNYDLGKEEDRSIAERIVRSDIDHIEKGTLRPTAMFGIFRC